MKLFVAICDDEAGQLEWMRQTVMAWAGRNGHKAEIAAFHSAENFLFEYGGGMAFDLLLLDVEMGGMNGLELAKYVRKKDSRAEIIFITSHFEFCGEGYEVDALHYLVKPVSGERLGMVLDRAAEKLAVGIPSVIIAREGETIKLSEQDILYVEAFLHYIMIHAKGREFKIKENLSSFEARLSDGFYRAHRSYLVSLKHIVRITRSSVWLDSGTQVPLARGKYDDINRAFINYN